MERLFEVAYQLSDEDGLTDLKCMIFAADFEDARLIFNQVPKRERAIYEFIKIYEMTLGRGVCERTGRYINVED